MATEWSGINLADAQDAHFNKEKPKQNLQKLKRIGKSRCDFPYSLDVAVDQTSKMLWQAWTLLSRPLSQFWVLITLSLMFKQLSTDDFNNVASFSANTSWSWLWFELWWLGRWLPRSVNLSQSFQCWGWVLPQDFGLDAQEDKVKIASLELDTYNQDAQRCR